MFEAAQISDTLYWAAFALLAVALSVAIVIWCASRLREHLSASAYAATLIFLVAFSLLVAAMAFSTPTSMVELPQKLTCGQPPVLDKASGFLCGRDSAVSGWRYRLHRKDLPGTPDIVLPGSKVALFVNGCFWHGHSCKLCRVPKSRSDFWTAKLEANRERDVRKIGQLASLGWRVMTVWQCSLADADRALEDIELFLLGVDKVAESRPITD